MSQSASARWRLIYFLLGALDLVAVVTSLLINHQMGEQYNLAVSVNALWTQRLATVEEIQALAGDVNAPGNDVFDSHNVRQERERLAESLLKFERKYTDLKKELASDSSAQARLLSSTYSQIQYDMEAMLLEAETIFTYFSKGRSDLAAKRMASMDRKYAVVRESISKVNVQINNIQKDFLGEQKKRGDRLRVYEAVFAVFIVVMVAAIFIFGTKISRYVAKTQHRLEQQQKALDASAIVAITDKKGIIEHVNDKFIDISGYSREELVGNDHRLINSRLHPKEYFVDMWRTISSGKIWRGEIRNRKKSGDYYWVDSTIVPITDEEGQLEQFVGIRHEITKRKIAEEQLLKAKNQAEEATKAKARFLANMSHEIRTPMNGIIGMTNLLLGSATDPEQIERLRIIQNCGATLLDLINDVLDFSKLEADKIELENEPFPLHESTHEVVELLNTKASEKGILLTYKMDPSVPTWVFGDVTRFRQILTNLVNNGIKFTERGSVTVQATAQPNNDQLLIQFAVQDSGIGIPTHVKDRLFQSFSQVDASTTRRFGGTGLGLAISKGLCEKMGGSIWVESHEGKGSIFYFSFLAKATAAPAKSQNINPFTGVDPQMGQKHPLRILIAEDNKTNQIVALGLLSKLGYQAAIANNGKEALELVHAKSFDLVLMDCHMPEMDGFTATRAIQKAYGQLARPRVVALTASITKEDIELCAQSGMEGFIGKPVTIQALVKTLGETLVHSDLQALNDLPKERFNMSDNKTTPFDHATFTENFSGMEDIAVETIKSFLASLPQLTEAVHTAILKKDAKALEISAHTLKGAVSNFYAEPSRQLAWKLEQQGHGNNFEGIDKTLVELKSELQKLADALRTFAKKAA